MTPEQIERREFSYCAAYYHEPYASHKFLVGTPAKREAERRAHVFAFDRWGKPYKVIVYPRTYVKEARALLAEGMHD